MRYILLERLSRLHAGAAPPELVDKKATKDGLKTIKDNKEIGLGEVVQAEKGYLWRDPKGHKVWYYYLRAWFDSRLKKIKGPYWYRKRRLGAGEYYPRTSGKAKGPGDIVDLYVGKRLPFKIPGGLSTNPSRLPKSVINAITKSAKIADKLQELVD